MPVIEAELSDFKDSKHFTSTDFCSGYWQCPLNPESYDAFGIIAPQGPFLSTRVLYGLTMPQNISNQQYCHYLANNTALAKPGSTNLPYMQRLKEDC